VTVYSLDDDWHMYQTAAYRIVMNGYWIEGGTLTSGFHRLLYRWIVAALHLLFGDSSVGEMYWDAACLLLAALVCVAIVKRVSGFRWGLVAGAMTLATFTASSTWYLIGRGLSEISGVGFMSFAALYLMRAKLGRIRAALVAGLFAVLMVYTRLNHLLLAGFMIAFLLPLRTEARWLTSGARSAACASPPQRPPVRRCRRRPAVCRAYLVVRGALQSDLWDELRAPADWVAADDDGFNGGLVEDWRGARGTTVDAGAAGVRRACRAPRGRRGPVGTRPGTGSLRPYASGAARRWSFGTIAGSFVAYARIPGGCPQLGLEHHAVVVIALLHSLRRLA
jgi:hypothetical protein